MYSLFFTFDVVRKFREICLSIDEIIYRFINYLFSVFDILSRTRLFSSDIIADFTNRTYIILSVVMLFALAYAIMTVIINPDKATNGDKSGFGIVKRVIVALIVLVFTPTVFNFAYGVQESVIDSNVIGKLVLGRTQSTTTEELKGEFVVSLFQGSFYLTDKAGDLATLEYEDASLSAKINGDIGAFEDLLDYVENGQARYNNLLSLIIGLFAAYCLVIFCFDLGVRCAKLAFFEMIAPIPALLYIIPGKESSFKTWTKEILNTFFEVFVRVGVIYFITYAFYLISKAFDNGSLLGDIASPSSAVGITVKLFIILGLLVFALRVPKLICDILGIKSEGLLSFKKRWDEGKKAIMAATTPARKAIGAEAGKIAAKRAYKAGVRAGNTDTFFKRRLASFHGLRNGWNGGLRNMGKAYDYELDVQDSYAHNRNKGQFAQIVGGVSDSLRDNFGFGSRYDYIKKRAELERDYENAPRMETINNLRRATEIKTQKIKADHKAYVDDNQSVFDAIVKRDEILEKELAKANSKEILDETNLKTSSYESSKTNTFKSTYVDAKGKAQSFNLYEFMEERARLVKEKASAIEIKRIDDAIADHRKDYLDYAANYSGMNWSSLEAMKQRAYDDQTLTEAQRTKIVNGVEAAKDALKIQYNAKDEADQLSAYVTANQELKNLLNLNDTKIGFKTISDGDGNVTGEHEEIDINVLRRMADGDEAFSIKKKIGKLIDEENRSLNNALAVGKITEDVVYYGDNNERLNAKGLTFLEANRILKDRNDKVEEKNKATEKLIESYVSEKVNAENRKRQSDQIKSLKKNNKV